MEQFDPPFFITVVFCSYLKAIQLTIKGPFPSILDTSQPCRSNAKVKSIKMFKALLFHFQLLFLVNIFLSLPDYMISAQMETSQKIESQLLHHVSACEIKK